MTKQDQEFKRQTAERALQLCDQGLDTPIICERLGISRHRLHQIRNRDKEQRREKAKDHSTEGTA